MDGGFSCPNRTGDGRGSGGCAYCGPGAARAPYAPGDGDDSIGAQVGAAVAFLQRRYGARLFFLYFQAFSSTRASVAELSRIYESAIDAARGLAELRGLVVSTRPDCLDSERVRLLSGYRDRGYEVWVELGLQTASDASLALMRRGHAFADFLRARELLAEAGIRTAVHLILGLPGEGRDQMLETVRRVADARVEGIKFHDLYLPKGSLWASEYLAGELVLMHPAR
ncbi:MAG: TIGR01212 family radical SAM protein, partial [Spirochaetaceae bacterium]|nr:TIGR01212 family radical SAM protein [Spirochaetaceae bacterium]